MSPRNIRSMRANAKSGITGIAVDGYKSVAREQRIDIRPLTILAGANSSGKSSIMQPLLMLKQTLEASYDPGSLLFSGPNVRFTSAEQLFSKCAKEDARRLFSVTVESGPNIFKYVYQRNPRRGLDLDRQEVTVDGERAVIKRDMPPAEASEIIPKPIRTMVESRFRGVWRVIRNRCNLSIVYESQVPKQDRTVILYGYSPGDLIEEHVRSVIHVPGLRGNPERTYPVTAVESSFPGTFETYVASVISEWQIRDKAKLEQLGAYLEQTGSYLEDNRLADQ